LIKSRRPIADFRESASASFIFGIVDSFRAFCIARVQTAILFNKILVR
jgi:hypothetical protein